MKITVPKKFKDDAERKQSEAKKKAKGLLKGKDVTKLSQSVKDELLIELCKINGLIDV
jgi:hypothetical protein